MNAVFFKYIPLTTLFFLVNIYKIISQPLCHTSELKVSTGFNHVTNSVYGTGDFDNLWRANNAPSNVISDVWGGVAGPNSTFISNSPNQTGFINIPGGITSCSLPNPPQPVVFTYSFCVDGPVGDLVLNIEVKADNMANVYFNYDPQPNGTLPWLKISPNPSYCPRGWDSPMIISSTNFRTGVNTILIELFSNGVDMGLNVSGTVKSPSGLNNILEPNCCVQNSSINGTCFIDTYGPNDGIYNGSSTITDGPLGGQPVFLEKLVGSTWTSLQSTMSNNTTGNYSFNGLAYGDYRVHQAPYLSYFLTAPLTNSGYHYVTINGNQIVTGKNFGNNLFLCCNFSNINTNPNPVCKNEPANFIISSCDPNTINTNYNYKWEYGDLTGPFYGLNNNSHTYLTTGTYNATMTATDPLGRCPVVEKQISVTVSNECCPNCTPSFRLIPSKKYIFSAWVSEEIIDAQQETFIDPEIWLEFALVNGGTPITIGPFLAKGNIIDEWQRVDEEFIVPALASDIRVKLMSRSGSSEPVYFDDVRIHPFDAGFKSYVYDPVTLKFTAELDNNNYATLYEYDEEGKLVRVKKETEIKKVTIKESRNSSVKRP